MGVEQRPEAITSQQDSKSMNRMLGDFGKEVTPFGPGSSLTRAGARIRWLGKVFRALKGALRAS